MKTSEVAVVILFEPGDGPKLLITLRPQQTYFGGWWEWPGGKRQGDETLEQCARRELMEETGLEAGVLHEFDRRVVTHPDREVSVTFFLGRALEGAKLKEGGPLARWVLPAEVLDYKFLEGSLPVLKRLIEESPRVP